MIMDVSAITAGMPVRQQVLSLPIPPLLRPKPVTPVPQVVHRAIAHHLLGLAGLKANQADSGALALSQRSWVSRQSQQ